MVGGKRGITETTNRSVRGTTPLGHRFHSVRAGSDGSFLFLVILHLPRHSIMNLQRWRPASVGSAPLSVNGGWNWAWSRVIG